ncbi:MAG: NAD(P)H-dependent oxidoreductase [Sphingomonas sp.]|jgi:NAD(P)H dehydrogenase (quinone)|uniref:NAD(P)H-dependent oxidoreductase n=1 Tax=Sphingomonas sp. TaxID=28214 RepID=UPI003569ADF9
MNDQPLSPTPRHVVILCHPEQESFNASVAHAYSAEVRQHGHEVIVRDLYAMGFHPVLKSPERPGPDFTQFRDVEDELAILSATDVFVLVYPLWFGTPPAMMKGYIERVLGSGVLPRDVHDRSAKGVLAGKRMLSFTSSGLKDIWLDEQGQLQSLITCFDHYLQHAFAMGPSQHHHYGSIASGMEPRWVAQHLEDVRVHARALVSDLDAERAAGIAMAT